MEHKGLELLVVLDIEKLVEKQGEEETIEDIAKLISRQARTREGTNEILRKMS